MKKSHTGRNIVILVLVVTAIGSATVLSGALSPQNNSYVVLIHVYDPAYGTPQTLNASAFVKGVRVEVSGPRSLNATFDSILGPEQVGTFPQGTYQIRAAKDGYTPATVTYDVGPTCEGRDQLGACHAWIAMSKISSSY